MPISAIDLDERLLLPEVYPVLSSSLSEMSSTVCSLFSEEVSLQVSLNDLHELKVRAAEVFCAIRLHWIDSSCGTDPANN